MPEHEHEEPLSDLIVKPVFLIIGVLIGMGIFWVALQWVPRAVLTSLRAAGVAN